MGDDTDNVLWNLVDAPPSAASGISDLNIFIDAYTGLLDLSGKCRHGVPTEDPDTGFSVHVHRCGLADLPGEKAGQKAASAAAGWADR